MKRKRLKTFNFQLPKPKNCHWFPGIYFGFVSGVPVDPSSGGSNKISGHLIMAIFGYGFDLTLNILAEGLNLRFFRPWPKYWSKPVEE